MPPKNKSSDKNSASISYEAGSPSDSDNQDGDPVAADSHDDESKEKKKGALARRVEELTAEKSIMEKILAEHQEEMAEMRRVLEGLCRSQLELRNKAPNSSSPPSVNSKEEGEEDEEDGDEHMNQGESFNPTEEEMMGGIEGLKLDSSKVKPPRLRPKLPRRGNLCFRGWEQNMLLMSSDLSEVRFRGWMIRLTVLIHPIRILPRSQIRPTHLTIQTKRARKRRRAGVGRRGRAEWFCSESRWPGREHWRRLWREVTILSKH